MGCLPGYWIAARPQHPPLITFVGNPEKLVSHLDWHGAIYTDNESHVDAIVANLEVEAVQWVMALHDKVAPALGDIEAFWGELRVQLGNIMQAQQAEANVRNIQNGME